jgi:hypothetical protein
MKNCFDRARKMGYNFAALSNGTNCHAYSEHGDIHKSRVNDAQCSYVCGADKGFTCGGNQIYSLWDVSNYNGFNSMTPLCKSKVYAPPDCSKYGGYNPKDLCM